MYKIKVRFNKRTKERGYYVKPYFYFIHSYLVIMLPLTMASQGEPVTIKKIGGKQETKKFLETLGFVVGGTITVVSEINGNMIVNVKDSRVAIGKDMANKIMV